MTCGSVQASHFFSSIAWALLLLLYPGDSKHTAKAEK
jgi:hypothetical protein